MYEFLEAVEKSEGEAQSYWNIKQFCKKWITLLESVTNHMI